MATHQRLLVTLMCALPALTACDKPADSAPIEIFENAPAMDPIPTGSDAGSARDEQIPEQDRAEPNMPRDAGQIENETEPAPMVDAGTGSPSENQPEPRSSGTGFAAQAIHWSVPHAGTDDGFFSPWWAMDTRWFATMDLNGDGRVDLIQTGDDSRENGFVWRDNAGPYWKVWPGEAEGFATDFIRWSVPESGLNDGFFYPSWSHGSRWFATRDLDGDGRIDLIQTADSSREGGFIWRDDRGPFWKVWRGGMQGFEAQFTRWSVPESGLDDGFFTLYWAHGDRWFATMDLNNDGRDDLVQTSDPNRQGGYVFEDESGPYWRVWLGEDNGFPSQAIRWQVPSTGLADGFFYSSWTQGERCFSTMDLTGDGLPDLVQSSDSSRSGGYVWTDGSGAYWKVWPGTGRGFANDWARWSVPDSGLGDGFFAPWWLQGERSFFTMDLTGDGRLDLVQTADSDRRGGFVWHDDAGAYWKVWPGSDNGFARAPHRWSVPSSGLDDGFYASSQGMGQRWFSTMDINGDRRPDLIQSADYNRDGGFVWRDAGGPHWRVWLNR